MTNREVELKLSLGEASHAKLLEILPCRGDLRHQKNIFLDGADFRLRKERWALRIREENGLWLLAAKGPSRRTGGISDRVEIEESVAQAQAELWLKGQVLLSELGTEPSSFLLNRFGDFSLSPWVSFENMRQVLSFEGVGLELDACLCAGVHRYELELELPRDQLDEVIPKLNAFFVTHGLPWLPSDQSKLAWAIEHSGNESVWAL